MLLRLRKILFYVFLGIYLILTPYVIFYSLGYTINPKERALVKTGLFSVGSVPHGAAIFIQGRKFSHKTPTVVTDLLPGFYNLRLQRKGYDTWEKEVEIYPERATQVEPVLLLPQKPEREIISAIPCAGMVPEIMDSKIIVWQNEKLASLNKIDLLFKKQTPIRPESKTPQNSVIEEIHVQPGSNIALLKVKGEKQTGFWLFDSGVAERKELRDLTARIQGKPDFFDWDPKNSSHLYYLKDGDIYRLDIQRDSPSEKILTGVLGFGTRYDRLVVLKKDFSLIETDLKGLNPLPLLEDAALIKRIFAAVSAHYYKIKILERNLFVFLSDHGTLISNRMPYYLVDKDIVGMEYASRGENDKLLYWTSHEIGYLDFTRTPSNIFERGPERKKLTDRGKNIRQAFWAYEDAYVVFLDENSINVLEAKGPEPYRVSFLERIAPDSLMHYSDRNRALYFLHGTTSYLIKRKLVE
ncbi:MAG: PEGA domain-containing protein [Candidatus Omnitrophica bacterium]|nr:PEGA domain-containing protein [Candidatus Omnitrophota bacterium]